MSFQTFLISFRLWYTKLVFFFLKDVLVDLHLQKGHERSIYCIISSGSYSDVPILFMSSDT